MTRGFVQRYGNGAAKRRLWNEEYSNGTWDRLQGRSDLILEAFTEKFARSGAVLDLGCGPGILSVKLKPEAYSVYTGIDISDVAIQKARQTARENGCANRNTYVQADIFSYEPTRAYNVILFGESIYYIQPRQIVPMLKRYSYFLAEDGAFIVRLFDSKGRRQYVVNCIKTNFAILESQAQMQVCLLAFRPKAAKH